MLNKIINTLKENVFTADELMNECEVNTSKELIDFNKTLNSLIDEGTVFEIKDKLYLTENYKVGKVKKDRGFIYVEDDRILEIENAQDFSLFSNDEIIYEPFKHYANCLKIVKRAVTYVLGTTTLRRRNLYFYSDDPRFTEYKVVNFKDFGKELKPNYRVRAYISNYQKRELKIDSIIGDANDRDVLVKTILLMNDAPGDFGDEVKKEVKALDDTVTVSEGRRDLRNLDFITIDGDDAKDFDDAIYVERKDEGYSLYVSIADVSHYVKERTHLDKEARSRGTSIYYPGKVIPMLPFKLCDDLCSLKEGVDRYTLTCQMNVGFDGEVSTYEIYPSVIKSKHRMTYSKVNKILDHDKELLEEYADICPMIYTAYELSRIVDKLRKSKGGIEFESNEPIIIEEDGKVVDIKLRTQGKAEILIEDFMILANETVASHMFYLNYPLVYRNHDYPKQDKIMDFIRHMEDLGYVFKGNKLELKSSSLQKCLSSFEGKEEYSLVSNMLLRSMAKALYESTSNGHYGLGLEHYCHFTSPIRRYPDLIVHRMLKKYIFEGNTTDIDLDNQKNEEMVKNCNATEKRAVQIERNILDLKRCEFMKDKVGQIFDAMICSVVKYGFYVELGNTVEGLVHISKLGVGFVLNDDEITNGEISYKVGQKIKVRLIDVDLQRRNIDFEIAKKRRSKPQDFYEVRYY
ncbi:MAG: ribonuclease R [Erysipelotrichaceae bacterium]|nr:ribonuclease R [Erysipelotrichaceae bacterium]